MEKTNPLSRDIAIVIMGYLHYHQKRGLVDPIKIGLENKFFDELSLKILEPFGEPGYLQIVLTGFIKNTCFSCSMGFVRTISERYIQHEAERLVHELTYGVINNMGIQ